jgi:LmbE family N-acetylglucosaminyl deacetylase
MLVTTVLAVSITLSSFRTPSVSASPTTTLTFVAHQDDDLLFMNPDVASDIQAGYNVWVVYLTAGDIPYREGNNYGGMEYVDMRIQGVRAAYARTASVPNNWTYQAMYFNGHEVATNVLNGTNVRLVFTFMHAAANPEDSCGDLFRMLHDPSFVANPIDGRAPYTYGSYVGMLRSIIQTANPNYMRTQSTIGHRDAIVDHVDHVAGAILAADADVDGQNNTWKPRYEYSGYVIQNFPENIFGYWRNEKTAIWDQYLPNDPELAPGSWSNLMGRQYIMSGRIFAAGVPWVPPGDFNSCPQ